MEKKITCELRDKWTANLLSGEYAQGHHHLERGGRYCCLGVLCVSAGIELKPYSEQGNLDGEMVPPDEYRPFPGSAIPILKGEAFGIPQHQMDLLWRMNDGTKVDDVAHRARTFPEIAEWIQENVECE